MLSRFFAISLAAVCVCTLVLFSCSKKDGDSDDEVEDSVAPGFISDFRVSAVSDSSVTLTWTATGDDGDSGTAATYDIRCSDLWITPEDWDEAYQISGEPSPRVAGSVEVFEVCGLTEDFTYYFALQPYDEAGNCPYFSACGPATCFRDFAISFPDTALDRIIRAKIGKPEGQLYRIDVMAVTEIDGNFSNISSLSGLEYCPELSGLTLSHNNISDLTPFTNLRKLYDVQLNVNNITDIGPLANSINLARLQLRNNHISNLSALAQHALIHMLVLSNNEVSDLSVLVNNLGFADTDTLYITGNPLSETALNTQIPILQTRGVTVIN